jgi:hypothetical protein
MNFTYLRSSSINFIKPIREPRFTLDFSVTSKVVKGSTKHYQATLDFNDGCFTGEYNWIIPLNKGVVGGDNKGQMALSIWLNYEERCNF